MTNLCTFFITLRETTRSNKSNTQTDKERKERKKERKKDQKERRVDRQFLSYIILLFYYSSELPFLSSFFYSSIL